MFAVLVTYWCWFVQSSDVVLKWYVTDMIIYVGIPLKRPTHNPRSDIIRFTYYSG